MTIRSINWAVGVSLVAAVLTVGTIVPASAQVTAVPREGVAFNDTVTQKVKIETVDPDDRTVAFTLPDGQVLVLPVSSNAGNLANIDTPALGYLCTEHVATPNATHFVLRRSV